MPPRHSLSGMLRFRQAFNQELAAVQYANTTPNRIEGGRAEYRGDESPAVLERPAMKTNCSSGRALRGKAFYRTPEENYAICGHLIMKMILQAKGKLEGKSYHSECFWCSMYNEIVYGYL
ncbi:wtip protein [Culex quinquefasciatus]|uniref:Wtip protein n=1 Tax=Culex quinquefasciatus TaxID=7176 RepID=B0X4S0_CULQU|nr:wtip protein [Culex quinquefasciatus]|eukprot:XP_001864642.1 wtip protein [Culex quinquefasciatus]